MRATLDRYLAKINNPDVYLIHGDMWHFHEFADKLPDNVINCGIQEPTVVNIAAGLAYEHKHVFVYGVAGMIIHRAYEQLKLSVKGWGENHGCVTLLNSGHNNCYEGTGRGHMIDDDLILMRALGIPTHTPETKSELLKITSRVLRQEHGVNMIRFGWDDAPWFK